MTSTEILSTIKNEKLAVAVKQALRFHFEIPFAVIAAYTQVSYKNAWFQVQAKRGSNITPWDYRTEDQKLRSTYLAERLMFAYEAELNGADTKNL